MNIGLRNNVICYGDGPATLIFGHGYGCDQSMWRLIAPTFAKRFRVVLFDLVGSGRSDLAAYDRQKYSTLHAHADDLLEIVDAFATGPTFFIGHSVSAIIGMLAGVKVPSRFTGQVMVSPSPCYINDEDYVGGFNREEIDVLLDLMEKNFLSWAAKMAPVIMGQSGGRGVQNELIGSFCRNDADIAKHFGRVTFLSDHRDAVPRLQNPTLILQCSDDLIAPREVGEYMHAKLSASSLQVVQNDGHCPHMSAAGISYQLIESFVFGLASGNRWPSNGVLSH